MPNIPSVASATVLKVQQVQAATRQAQLRKEKEQRMLRKALAYK